MLDRGRCAQSSAWNVAQNPCKGEQSSVHLCALLLHMRLPPAAAPAPARRTLEEAERQITILEGRVERERRQMAEDKERICGEARRASGKINSGASEIARNCSVVAGSAAIIHKVFGLSVVYFILRQIHSCTHFWSVVFSDGQ